MKMLIYGLVACLAMSACKKESCDDIECNEWGCEEGACRCETEDCGCEFPMSGPDCDFHLYFSGSGDYFGLCDITADSSTVHYGDTICRVYFSGERTDMTFSVTPGKFEDRFYLAFLEVDSFVVLGKQPFVNDTTALSVSPLDTVGFGEYHHDKARLYFEYRMRKTGDTMRFDGIKTYE